jgi:hypothetical protein
MNRFPMFVTVPNLACPGLGFLMRTRVPNGRLFAGADGVVFLRATRAGERILWLASASWVSRASSCVKSAC